MASSASRIVAFSLFGDSPKYLNGALQNAHELQSSMPGWTPVFYHGNSINSELLLQLEDLGARVIRVPGVEDFTATLWRFRIFTDFPECQVFLARDVDSLIHNTELKLIEAWLETGKELHVLRGNANHFWHIPAGLTGFRRSSTSMAALDRVRLQSLGSYYGVDADVLYLEVWKQKNLSRVVHDLSCFISKPESVQVMDFEFPGRVSFDNNGDWIEPEPISKSSAASRIAVPISNYVKRGLERARLSKRLGRIV